MNGRDDKLPSRKSNRDEVSDFLSKVASIPATGTAGGKGRLIFAMDATASREPTWDGACHLQAEMFTETEALGGLEVQLVFYRGFNECKSSSFVSSPAELVKRMTRVRCLGGQTQIGKVLKHALKETERKKVNALVFVGDCMEEDVDSVCHVAGQLGLRGVPAFMFQEGDDPIATRAFRQIARLTNGAHCRFDSSSARHVRELLAAVAVYAAGGRRALENYGKRTGETVLQIASQLK